MVYVPDLEIMARNAIGLWGICEEEITRPKIHQ